MEILNTALFWLSQGVATIPLTYRSKRPLCQWTPFRTRLPSEMQLAEWFTNGRMNMALVTGWQGLVILDFDSPESYSAWLCWQLTYQPEIVQTYRVLSNRGIHVYYYLSKPAKLRSIQSALFEVKTAGLLCTTPPSVHESGRRYTSLDDLANIRTVKPEQILNYSPVSLNPPIVFPTRSKFAPVDVGREDIIPSILQIPVLGYFLSAQPVDDEKRFYRTHCPFHGHKDNFWIDTQLNICGCFAGCGSFDSISLYAALNKISNSESVKQLRRLL